MKRVGKFALITFLIICGSILVIYLVRPNASIPVISTSQSSPALQETVPQQTQSPPAPQVTEYPTRNPFPTGQVLGNGWLRFTYTEAGYSIDYPADATLYLPTATFLDFSEAIIRFPGSVDENNQSMEISTFINKENKSLDQNAYDVLFERFHENTPKVDRNVNKYASRIEGYSALSFDVFPNCPAVFIESKDRFYFLFLGPDMMSGTSPTNESVELFLKILESFRIL